MPDPKPPRGGKSSPQSATTPEDFPTNPPRQLPSGDYSYTVELVGSINRELGHLAEAVNGLKEQSKDRDKKHDELVKEIRAVALDVHGAKAAGKALLWVVSIIGAILGICAGAYLQAQFPNRPPRPLRFHRRHASDPMALVGGS
jgi:hypothetical protein